MTYSKFAWAIAVVAACRVNLVNLTRLTHALAPFLFSL
jgi:hypothetical protein